MQLNKLVSATFALTVLSVSHLSLADQACLTDLVTESTPTTQFVVDSDLGVATDIKTGVSWMVCSAGMTWDSASATCTGEAMEYNWQESLAYADTVEYAGYNDWRLPNIKELMSIVERACSTPALNTSVFVDALAQRYWTNTPVIGSDGNGGIVGDTVWAVSFEEGSNNQPLKTANSMVRLVRKAN